MLKCLKQRANKVVVQFSIMQKGLDSLHIYYTFWKIGFMTLKTVRTKGHIPVEIDKLLDEQYGTLRSKNHIIAV